MKSIDIVTKQIKESADIKNRLYEDKATMTMIADVADVCVNAYKNGKKTLWAGNGGSAADAQHMAGEMVSKFYFDRPALTSIALTTDTSIITAIGNDYGYDHTFSRQLEAQGNEGDVFIGISTSGNSQNLVKCLDVCRKKGIVTVALVGEKPCKMDEWDYAIKIPSSETPRIQECQTLIGHIICCIVEQKMFGR